MNYSNKINIFTRLLNLFGIIIWRKNPGCFERHLQRRCNNLLFPPSRRKVTLLELDLARQKDDVEKDAFYKKIKQVLNDFPRDEEDPIQMIQNSKNAYRSIGKLIEESFSIGDNSLSAREELLVLEKAHFDFVIKHQPNLKEPFLDYQALSNLTRVTWLMQIIRSDSPILKEEDVASLLSEDSITIQNVAEYFTMAEDSNPTPIEIIDRSKIVAVLENAYKNGFSKSRGQTLLNAYSVGTSATRKINNSK